MKRKPTSSFGIFLFISIIITTLSFFLLHLYTTRVIAYLSAINLSTFILYSYDKLISVYRGLRVPENILHLLELSGGSPAALLSQHLFRHKVSKLSFQWIFWGIILLQGMLFLYFKPF